MPFYGVLEKPRMGSAGPDLTRSSSGSKFLIVHTEKVISTTCSQLINFEHRYNLFVDWNRGNLVSLYVS